jgi:hypothetical protein
MLDILSGQDPCHRIEAHDHHHAIFDGIVHPVLGLYGGAETVDPGLAGRVKTVPAIIGNVGQNISVDAAAVTNLFSKAVHLPVPRIPTIPAGVTSVSVSGADPTLSLVGAVRANGIDSVGVMLDHPHPAGSTGMTEAHLALTYDPSVLSVSASDITLGSIPGAGWRITSEVDDDQGPLTLSPGRDRVEVAVFRPDNGPHGRRAKPLRA